MKPRSLHGEPRLQLRMSHDARIEVYLFQADVSSVLVLGDGTEGVV